MKRAVHTAACAVLALLVTAGCGTTPGQVPVDAMMANVSSVPKAPGADDVDGLPPGRVEALLISDDDVSRIVGLPMHGLGLWQMPGPVSALRDRDDCRVLTVSDQDFWTVDFTAYRETAQQDSDEVNFYAWQGVGAYPNSRTASQVFRRAINADLQARCRTAVLSSDTDDNAMWRVDSLTTTNSTLSVLVSQQLDGQATGWRCATQLRLRRNVIHRDGACQAGNPSTTARQLADMTSDRIGG